MKVTGRGAAQLQRLGGAGGLCVWRAATGDIKKPRWWAGLFVLHVKEVLLLNFLVVMKMPVPTALVDPLAVLSRLSETLRGAASQQ